MTGAEAGRLVADYMRELEKELADLPRARCTELLEEIERHIDEAVAEEVPATEADVRTLLDRIGEPADIAEEARERFGVTERRRGFLLEHIALLMLTTGSIFAPVIGWLIGAALLWTSPRWTTEDKVLGTLIVPFGLLPAAYFWIIGTVAWGDDCPVRKDPNGGWIQEYCMSAPGYAIGIFLVVAPIAMAFYLARRMRRAA